MGDTGNGSKTPTRYRGTCRNGHTVRTIVSEVGTRDGKWIRCRTCEQDEDLEVSVYCFARNAKDVEEWYAASHTTLSGP